MSVFFFSPLRGTDSKTCCLLQYFFHSIPWQVSQKFLLWTFRGQEPITRSLHLPYKLYETTFARIFLFLETVGLLDSRTIYATQYNEYNTTQQNTTQQNTTQYNALYNMLSWKVKLAWGENCSRNTKICAKVDSRIYGRWRLRVMGSCRGLTP